MQAGLHWSIVASLCLLLLGVRDSSERYYRDDLARLTQTLSAVLADVRAAVEDWQPMRGVLRPQGQGVSSRCSSCIASEGDSTCSPSCASHSSAKADPCSVTICSNNGT